MTMATFSPPRQQNNGIIISLTTQQLSSENTTSNNDIVVVSPSSECAKRKNTIEFEKFCHEQTYSKYQCQKMEITTGTTTNNIPLTDGRRRRRRRRRRRSSSTSTSATNTTTTTTTTSSSSHCKTIWITGMSLGFEGKHNIADRGDGYALQDAAAIRSYQIHAKDVLQPVLIMLTPKPTPTPTPSNISSTSIINNNNENRTATTQNNSSNKDSLATRFTRWLEKQGVIVINIHTLSFQKLVFRAYPEYAKNGAIAYYLRFDIPKILLESSSLLDQPGICGSSTITTPGSSNSANNTSDSNVVLYTDSDILFVQPIDHDEIQSLKGELTKDKFLMYGQDFLIDREKPCNTGVMFMHLEGFRNEWPNILRWGKKRLKKGKKKIGKIDLFPKHDQLWLNEYYTQPTKWKAQNLLLPPVWNWKVYWEMHSNYSDSNNNNDIIRQQQLPIKLVHFHGPKPQDGIEEIARCDTEAVYDVLNATATASSSSHRFHPDYEMLISHGMCCDLGKTAAWVSQLYDRWKPHTIPW
jgi:hypothetical protein